MTDREAVYIQKNYGLSRYQAAKLVREADELDQSLKIENAKRWLRNKRAEERHMIILRRKKHLHELRASLDPQETP